MVTHTNEKYAEISNRGHSIHPPTHRGITTRSVGMTLSWQPGFCKHTRRHTCCGDTWKDLSPWPVNDQGSAEAESDPPSFPPHSVALSEITNWPLDGGGVGIQSQKQLSQGHLHFQVFGKSTLWIKASRKHCVCPWNLAHCVYFSLCNSITDSDSSLQETCNSG